MKSSAYSINMVGDVMLGRLIDQLFPTHVHEPQEASHIASFVSSNPHLKDYGPSSPWGDTLPLFKEADLNMINLETSVTTSNRPWPNKVFNYRMHPKNIAALLPAHIHYATLANNHTLDFSQAGLIDTVETLRKAGIAFAGAGLSRVEATTPATLLMPFNVEQAAGKKQRKVQIWAASDHPNDWSSVPGFHLMDYSIQSRANIKDTIIKTQAADVALKIFSVHWGPNYTWSPAEGIRSMAHFLVDECGIDIVHGHSSHHIKGVEKYNGKLIIYGCGDFVDDYALTPKYRNNLSAVWRVGLDDDQDRLKIAKLELFPTKVVRFQAQRVQQQDDDHSWLCTKFRKLCNDLGTEVEDGVGEDNQLAINM